MMKYSAKAKAEKTLRISRREVIEEMLSNDEERREAAHPATAKAKEKKGSEDFEEMVFGKY
jgi:hypothetical protein